MLYWMMIKFDNVLKYFKEAIHGGREKGVFPEIPQRN